MLGWKRYSPPASEHDVQRFEMTSGILMPRCYRRYLLSSNGGQPTSEVGFKVDELGEIIMLGCLYSLCSSVAGVDLEVEYQELKDDVPADVLPVGDDPGGNILLVSTTGDDADSIYYWDRVGFFSGRFGKRIFRVAKNIEAFLASLDEVQDH